MMADPLEARLEATLEELGHFLSSKSRLDLTSNAVGIILGLSGTSEGCELVIKADNVLCSIVELATQHQYSSVQLQTLQTLVNISAIENGVSKLLETCDDFFSRLLQGLVVHNDVDVKAKEYKCMILSNLTRLHKGSSLLSDILLSRNPVSLDSLVNIFDKDTSTTLDYLAKVFSNITQQQPARQWFLSKGQGFDALSRLLPYTRHESVIRRSGIIGLLRNLCFETDCHKSLLEEQIDFLPAVLLPLAGPELFNDEENDQLPLECQYLPDDKIREDIPDVRTMLLEILLKLCVSSYGRHYLRSHGVYFILRELHKWEKVATVVEACESVVSILISDET